MREFTQKLPLSQGLNPLQGAALNSGFLTTCKNLAPDNGRLIKPTVEEYPIPDGEGVAKGFPFPQLFICQRYKFLTTATGIYLVQPDWSLISLWGGLTAAKTWHAADFAEFVIFTNGLVTLCYPEMSEQFAEINCFQYW